MQSWTGRLVGQRWCHAKYSRWATVRPMAAGNPSRQPAIPAVNSVTVIYP